jgi:YVTN family beta-propeller protein
MAAFITRTMDQSLKRNSRRVVLEQPWTTQPAFNPGTTSLAASPTFVQSDGEDLWVVISNDTVSRVHGSDGRVLGTWTGATGASNPLVAMGLVFISGNTAPGALYMIDPTGPGRAVTTVTTTTPIGDGPTGLAFDGARIWTANFAGSVSIITPGAGLPWVCAPPVTGFLHLSGILFDGSNIWVTGNPNLGLGAIAKLDQSGAVLSTTGVGSGAGNPVFDGTNIWVPNQGSNSVTVIRASTGAVLATLTGNGLNGPVSAAFDGERVLVTNAFGDSVSLWKATDFTPLTLAGGIPTGANSHPFGACSDGLNFWLTLANANSLARY